MLPSSGKKYLICQSVVPFRSSCSQSLSVLKAVQLRSITVAGMSVADGSVMTLDDITELRSITFIHILKLNVEIEM